MELDADMENGMMFLVIKSYLLCVNRSLFLFKVINLEIRILLETITGDYRIRICDQQGTKYPQCWASGQKVNRV